ncbi:hypothetical protein DIE23_16735 [Burkholderia sp. Bp9143]|uniref:hypothetical protein n=1 Tax=Burkholderia sp. Bp9143 TaxID=2184574 RepID=UPI000F598E2C|nr:hypothetical protein [Burkholderia sp. Bp9143]RQR32095.1 hypothetical protein DIE23_16735 [Burkholderia sp. Bp9143]
MDAIIGYRTEIGGVAYIYDLEGTCVSVTEKPLEAPLVDPVDTIFVVGAMWRSGARAMARIGGYGTHAIIGRPVLSGLRTRFAASSSKQLRFAATPLAAPATARMRWDEDSFTLSCDIRHAPDNRTARPSVLRDRLDDQLGVQSETRHVITAGSLTLTLDGVGRLCSFDFYTNADHWQKAGLPPPIPVSPHTPRFSAAYDALGRASVREPATAYDSAARCLSLVWHDDASVRYAIAPNLSVATTPDGNLARIDIGDIAPF